MKVIELFAGVGGFRIGLERASASEFEFVWSNQFEPGTKKQDASEIYQARFGLDCHANVDINLVPTEEIPAHDLMVGGFPCQDYSVASTSNHAGGIEGKKGVLWWQIYRILLEKGNDRPSYLIFENVDRLLNSPSSQRGRDFAIILASLSDLGYIVEWRVINAAEYGMPQRRKRTYIIGYRKDSEIGSRIGNADIWLTEEGIMSRSFPARFEKRCRFDITGNVAAVSENFNRTSGKNATPFMNSGVMYDRHVVTMNAIPEYDGPFTLLRDIIVDEKDVPEDFFISDEELERWRYIKGPKRFERTSKDGHSYIYSEGGMGFPDSLDRASRTVITGEGGKPASRFKHVIVTPSGRYRRLVPLELERLNMFPDNHTQMEGVSDIKRAFLMGNALVCGIVERIGRQFVEFQRPVK